MKTYKKIKGENEKTSNNKEKTEIQKSKPTIQITKKKNTLYKKILKKYLTFFITKIFLMLCDSLMKENIKLLVKSSIYLSLLNYLSLELSLLNYLSFKKIYISHEMTLVTL